jgi:hypothetical protein
MKVIVQRLHAGARPRAGWAPEREPELTRCPEKASLPRTAGARHNHRVVHWQARPRASDETWGADVWSVWARGRRLAGETGELMGVIAAQRSDRARVYRQLAARTADSARARRFLDRAQTLDSLAERARRFAASEDLVARTPTTRTRRS